MGNALQDQLLKAGLVSDRQLKKAKKEKRKEERQPHKHEPHTGESEASKRSDKVERDRALNRQRQEELEIKARVAQVRQLVEAHRQVIEPGEVLFSFVVAGKVKRLHIGETLRRKLVKGQLAIVTVDGGHDLVPADIADKIQSRCADCIAFWNTRDEPQTATQADEYAGYEVPDDLIW